ncbi:hypothetical protein BC833DRAFT_618718 [Globomyces pollinis-pini]|nr:hypothetical protein BC833DRAFT_618718 [Globomyces pollinis-pini]
MNIGTSKPAQKENRNNNSDSDSDFCKKKKPISNNQQVNGMMGGSSIYNAPKNIEKDRKDLKDQYERFDNQEQKILSPQNHINETRYNEAKSNILTPKQNLSQTNGNGRTYSRDEYSESQTSPRSHKTQLEEDKHRGSEKIKNNDIESAHKYEHHRSDSVSQYAKKLELFQEMQEHEYKLNAQKIQEKFQRKLQNLEDESMSLIKKETDLIHNGLKVNVYESGPVVIMPKRLTTDYRELSNSFEDYRLKFEENILSMWKSLSYTYETKKSLVKSQLSNEDQLKLKKYEFENQGHFDQEIKQLNKTFDTQLKDLRTHHEMEYKKNEQQLKEQLEALMDRYRVQIKEQSQKLRDLDIEMANRYANSKNAWETKLKLVDDDRSKSYRSPSPDRYDQPIIVQSPSRQKHESISKTIQKFSRQEQSDSSDSHHVSKGKKFNQKDLSAADLSDSSSKHSKYHKSKGKSHHQSDQDDSNIEAPTEYINGHSTMAQIRLRMQKEEENMNKTKSYLNAQRQAIQSGQHLDHYTSTSIQSDEERYKIQKSQKSKKFYDAESESESSTEDYKSKKKIYRKKDVQSRSRSPTHESRRSEKASREPKKRHSSEYEKPVSKLDDINRDLDQLMKVLTEDRKVLTSPKSKYDYKSVDYIRPSRSYERHFDPDPVSFHTRDRKGWSSGQSRSKASLSEHQEWLENFSKKQRDIF